MNKKLKKILKKFLIVLPIFLIPILLFKLINDITWTISIISIAIADFAYLASNIFDYDYFNDIDFDKDYLESTHTESIEFTAERWILLNDISAIIPVKVKNVERNDSEVKYEIIQKRLNSTIRFTHDKNKILIQIEKNILKNIPDKAVNYSIYRKVLTKLKN